MTDMISCEEVFEADAQARGEFDVVCDAWLNEAIEAQEVEMAPEPVVADGVDLGRLFDRMRAPRDWAGSEFADAVYGPTEVEEEEEVCWCKSFESCSLCFGKK